MRVRLKGKNDKREYIYIYICIFAQREYIIKKIQIGSLFFDFH